jgi:hypothetical protein
MSDGMVRAIKTRQEIHDLIVSHVNRMPGQKITAIPIHVTGPTGGASANWTAGSDDFFKTAGTETESIIRFQVAFLQEQYDISD